MEVRIIRGIVFYKVTFKERPKGGGAKGISGKKADQATAQGQMSECV